MTNEFVASHSAQLTSVAYSPNANCINAEVVGDYEVKLYQYVPGQLAAQYTFKLDMVPTGVENIINEMVDEGDAPVEYYNLQWIKVKNPEKRNLYKTPRFEGCESKILI